ncbi:hypothetical protein [Alteromonas portus]|uniref:hypothetical protein n=1 Tax=Alteromonas portus TaxID=2565549 RepID=UPI003BF80823
MKKTILWSDIIANIIRGPRIFFAKNTIRYSAFPFELDLSDFNFSDYENIIPFLNRVDNQLSQTSENKHGMQFIHLGETVYFKSKNTLNIPFSDFVSKVDIAHVGLFYRDSLSANTKVVEKDEDGRSILQAVRIVALPQPNYSSFLGKGNLDVYKLEKIVYTENFQQVWMKTVLSPNNSAVCDDGYMKFESVDQGRATTVSFLACQNFPIPPLMALAKLDKWTWLKEKLTEAAYTTFSNRMMKNIEDCYYSKDFRVGKPSFRYEN